jgi:hypothetical protein
MKKIVLTGVPASLMLVCQLASAQTLNFQTGAFVTDFKCPVVSAKRPIPAKVVGASSHVTAPVVMGPPEPDEIGDARTDAELYAPDLKLHLPTHSDAGEPVSMAFWGDSHLAANFFGDELMRLSGIDRQKILPTFIPATMARPGVRLPLAKFCQSPTWNYRLAYQAAETGLPFAQGLSALRSSTENSYLWVDFRFGGMSGPALRNLDVMFHPTSVKATVALSVDDAEEQIVELNPDSTGVIQVRTDHGMSQIKLRLLSGELVLEGFKPQYQEQAPGLILDTFAVPGATIKGWANVDADYMRQRLDDRKYDLVVLEFGTNEGNSRSFSAATYKDDLRAALSNLRQVFPASRCVMMGPPDRGVLVQKPAPLLSRKKSSGRGSQTAVKAPKLAQQDLLKFSRIHEDIENIQRVVGEEYDCSLWNWQEAMGGEGAAYRWFYHTPRLMAKDLTHMTIPGYQLTARKFAESLDYQNWFVQGPR